MHLILIVMRKNINTKLNVSLIKYDKLNSGFCQL